MESDSATLQPHEKVILELAAETNDDGTRKLSTRDIASRVHVSQSTVVRVLNKAVTGPMPIFAFLPRRSALNRERVIAAAALYLILLLSVMAAALATIAW